MTSGEKRKTSLQRLPVQAHPRLRSPCSSPSLAPKPPRRWGTTPSRLRSTMATPPESIAMTTCALSVRARNAPKRFASNLLLLFDFRVSCFQFILQTFRAQAFNTFLWHSQRRQFLAPAIAFRPAVHRRIASCTAGFHRLIIASLPPKSTPFPRIHPASGGIVCTLPSSAISSH